MTTCTCTNVAFNLCVSLSLIEPSIPRTYSFSNSCRLTSSSCKSFLYFSSLFSMVDILCALNSMSGSPDSVSSSSSTSCGWSQTKQYTSVGEVKPNNTCLWVESNKTMGRVKQNNTCLWVESNKTIHVLWVESNKTIHMCGWSQTKQLQVSTCSYTNHDCNSINNK